MKRLTIIGFLLLDLFSVIAQKKVEWISTSQNNCWEIHKGLKTTKVSSQFEAEILLDNPEQTIHGFGTCFNELGWTSLSFLGEKDRKKIFRELFSPGAGANFTICRIPVAANDFSRNWYSYNETDGDFDMNSFSIENDLETLVPYIKSALEFNPGLKIWASPWSPPVWMKYNKHYAMRAFPKRNNSPGTLILDNGLKPGQEGQEGRDMFIQEEKYFQAYALYFSKFIEAYREQDIHIFMVMPQNEFNSAQVFPSCTWTSAGLARFIRYLGPAMQSLGVDVFFGTMERPDEKLVDTILIDHQINKYIKGAGFQWAGKESIAGIHNRYPELSLYQTEQECGDGKNDWKFCKYSWDLMKHYFNSGTNAYLYWNTSLAEGGISTWGWRQNSLVSVDTVRRTYKYNYEYFLMKHFSHYVQPGAKLLPTEGTFNDLIAFINPDQSIAVIIQNESSNEKIVNIKAGNIMISPALDPDSFNTFLIKGK